MIKRLGALSAICAAAGVLAGCGSGGTQTVTVTTPVPAGTTPTATGTTPAGTTAGGPNANIKAAEAANPAIARQIAQAVASCKTSINAQPSLTAADKTKLDAICDKAGSGDTTGVQKATADVCQQIVRDTVAAASQARALAACPKP